VLGGNLSVAGAASIGNALSVAGNLTGGSLGVAGTATIGGTLGVTGEVSAKGGLTVTGNVGIGTTTSLQARLDVAGFVRLGLDEGGSGPKTISFSRDSADEGNAGKIAYKPSGWDNTALCIVGAGAFPRKTRIFDDLVVDRNVGVGGNLSVAGNLSIHGTDLQQRLNKSLAADGTLLAGSVGEPQLANGAVTAAAIAGGAVPLSKLKLTLTHTEQATLAPNTSKYMLLHDPQNLPPEPAFFLVSVHVDSPIIPFNPMVPSIEWSYAANLFAPPFNLHWVLVKNVAFQLPPPLPPPVVTVTLKAYLVSET
jgi:hypothetical protein